MNPQQTAKQPRVEVVDALRGFAVMAILLVHSVEHFNFYIYPTDQPDWLAWLDRSVFCGVFALMAGKSYAIFALLFGFTFYVQWSNQRRQGRDFGYRFLWRLLLLVGFASLNSVFFMAGDVLLLFAAVGIILFLVRNCSDKVVLGLAVLFLLQPVEWFHYAAGAIDPAYRAPDLGVGALFGEAIAYTQQGDFLHFVRNNLLTGQRPASSGPSTPGATSRRPGSSSWASISAAGSSSWAASATCGGGSRCSSPAPCSTPRSTSSRSW